MDLETTIEKLGNLRRKYLESENHQVSDTLAEALEFLEDYSAVLDKVEYAIGRPAFMPDMRGKERFIIISGDTFYSYEQAYTAMMNIPSLRDRDAVILERIGPVTDWEVADDGMRIL